MPLYVGIMREHHSSGFGDTGRLINPTLNDNLEIGGVARGRVVEIPVFYLLLQHM